MTSTPKDRTLELLIICFRTYWTTQTNFSVSSEWRQKVSRNWWIWQESLSRKGTQITGVQLELKKE
jgi:hypothetical protein